MVTWIPLDNKVYEISYTSKQQEFSQYLNTVQKMIGSFHFISPSETVSNVFLEGTDTKERPLLILK